MINTKKYAITKVLSEGATEPTGASAGSREQAVLRVKQMFVDMGYVERMMWENGDDINSTLGVCEEDNVTHKPYPHFMVRRVS